MVSFNGNELDVDEDGRAVLGSGGALSHDLSGILTFAVARRAHASAEGAPASGSHGYVASAKNSAPAIRSRPRRCGAMLRSIAPARGICHNR